MSSTKDTVAKENENAGSDEETRTESPPVVGVSKRAKTRRHCRKFWWAWLIGILIFLLIWIIAIIYGIIPRVAQDKLNDTVLHLHSMEIANPSESSLQISINATITGDAPSNAHLSEFDLSFYLDGQTDSAPFLKVPMNAVDGGHEIPILLDNVTVPVDDEKALEQFARTLLDENELKVDLRGDTEIWLGKIHTNVDYRETLNMQGFKKLEGMTITSFGLVKGDDANTGGKVLIPNPTDYTIELGDVGIDIALGDEFLANGTLPALTIRPGDNKYDYRAFVETDKLQALTRAITSRATLNITGTGAAVGGKEVPWLSNPLSELTVPVAIDISS